MKQRKSSRYWYYIPLLCIALLGASHAQTEQPVPWPQAAFSYYAQDRELEDVLREFSADFSLGLQISGTIQGTVNGRFNTATPSEFLDRLGGVYGFNWFTHAGTLYVSHTSAMVTDTIDVGEQSISSLRAALLQMKVLDPRFGWGELPDQGLALVSGPPAYIALIKRTVAALPKNQGSQQVAVFRLRHASVIDRIVRYRDTKITTPGIATMLRDLLTGTGNYEGLSVIAAPLRDNPPVVTETDTGVINPSPAKPDASVSKRRQWREPTIQADTRLNAVIIQDIPSRMPIYHQLIEQLDVPSTLIEIEAMIVDVNAEVVDELGVTWSARSGKASFGHGNLGLTPSGGLPVDAAAKAIPGMIGLSVGNRLVARLRALEGAGDAQILSQPSILTADNLGAMIDLSETFYIQTRGERVAEVTPVTVGTSLLVTPRYIRGGNEAQVELAIDIEDGRIQDEREIDNLPTVRKSNISTLAVVADGQVLLIGGYNSSHESERVDKVPLLGDIPGLGILFSNRSRTWQRRERLFLIRPRVVSVDGVRVVPDSTSAVDATEPDAGMQQIESEWLRRREQQPKIDRPARPEGRVARFFKRRPPASSTSQGSGWKNMNADEYGWISP